MYVHPLIHAHLARQRGLDLCTVVSAARGGDADAWESLVARFTPTIQAVARGYRLDVADVEDVVQTTWATAFASIGRIRRAEAIGGWLCVTARREAARTAQRRQRELPVEELPDSGRSDATPENALLVAERLETVRAAIGRLSHRERRLLTALTHSALSYAEVARDLDVPVGSIGPTRDRALARLRRDTRLAAIHHTAT